MKNLIASLVFLIGAILPAQTPKAELEYIGKGCGHYATQNNFRILGLPKLGNSISVYMLVPPYGVDFIQIGTINPNFKIPITHTNYDCYIHAFAFPYPIRTHITNFQNVIHTWTIPNDTSLLGKQIYVQALNYTWIRWPGQYGWETSRAARLKFGY